MDILALVIAYLDGALDSDVVVASRVPDPRPARFVQVRLAGWPKLPPVRRTARVIADAWGADVVDEEGAMALGVEVRDAIEALYGTDLLAVGATVYRVEETAALRQSEDPLTRTPRCSATYAITHRDDTAVR